MVFKVKEVGGGLFGRGGTRILGWHLFPELEQARLSIAMKHEAYVRMQQDRPGQQIIGGNAVVYNGRLCCIGERLCIEHDPSCVRNLSAIPLNTAATTMAAILMGRPEWRITNQDSQADIDKWCQLTDIMSCLISNNDTGRLNTEDKVRQILGVFKIDVSNYVMSRLYKTYCSDKDPEQAAEWILDRIKEMVRSDVELFDTPKVPRGTYYILDQEGPRLMRSDDSTELPVLVLTQGQFPYGEVNVITIRWDGNDYEDALQPVSPHTFWATRESLVLNPEFETD